MTDATLPKLEGFEEHYGIQVSVIGEDFDMMIVGHHDDRRAVAAFRRYARTVCGVDLIERRDATLANAASIVDRRWAIKVDDAGSGWDFYFRTNGITAETPGAFPVTLWVVS